LRLGKRHILAHHALQLTGHSTIRRHLRSHHHGIATLSSLTFLLLASAVPDAASALDGVEFAQLRIQQTVVIRVPSAPPPPPRFRWREKKTMKCIPVSGLGGYAISQPDSIDLIVKGGMRYRAKLERGCPSVAFYSGFYIQPPVDGRICAGRDMFHSRTGGQCSIDKLRSLVPEK
jgi:hypothetical protein